MFDNQLDDKEMFSLSRTETLQDVNNSNSNSNLPRNRGPIQFWNVFPDSTSEFMSAIMGLCKCFESIPGTEEVRNESALFQDPFLSLKNMFMALLGQLGAPDILTLRHSDFPAKHGGNVYQISLYKVADTELNFSI